ncbi:MAG TPA: DNA methyltransferase [Gemmataceae bacterium]|jgi:hypothetical protein
MARDPEVLAHLEWLGYVQPVGLVVSVPALLAAQAHVGRITPADHQAFLACLPRDKDDELVPEIRELREFVQSALAWEAADLQEPPTSLEVPLPEYHETLRPTFVVPEFQPKDAKRPWLMLLQCLPRATDFDIVHVKDERHWQATPQARMERLLRETDVPIGLLFNHTQLRLVYAPRGETSGYATFNVADMASVAGRPIFAALRMLLHQDRLFRGSDKERLPAILADSRKYQNVVSTQLAEQVLAALYELLRGFQAADDATRGRLLRDVLAKDPNHVYAGLLTVLMRLVFVLYAEDRGLLSTDSVYANYYSVTGLFDRLRADAGRYPDTMNQRYGAWAQLLTVFRLIHEGGSHAGFQIPARKGYLFDPERYPFLEGRSMAPAQAADGPAIPRVSDGVIFRVLNNLLILDGERLSYRTLDVEQIGSVYETMMGFDLQVANGRSIAIKPTKAHGAPTSINLEELLAAKSGDRAKWLAERTDQKLSGQAADALKKASSIEDLLAALEKKIANRVTPNTVPKGAMIFQPSNERRRSGSHYTPRSLTEPIVRNTLEPILKQLGDKPTPKQLLDLKVCDPAMGSGAFLVEACRQLGDVLVKAWHVHKQVPKIPPDEDEILHARRLIAQRCLYGVDKNPMAVDLAKLALWLATLAKDHPFTFLDHALRHGDSLVGLTRKQISEFHWQPAPQRSFGQEIIEERIQAATRVRQEIIEAGDEVPFLLKQQKLALADESLNLVRFAGNLVIAAFFVEDNEKKRKAKREELLQQLSGFLQSGNMTQRPTKPDQDLRSGDKAIHPFHWEIEFPEVFGRNSGGFDAIVGNPPFAGKNTLVASNRKSYPDWLKALHEGAHGNADLVAHFFRRAFNLLRPGGTFGLIATNTIAQGDTRSTGLRFICTHGATIYLARRRYKWPGQAAVVVSIVHVLKGPMRGAFDLDGKSVERITAYLFHTGGHDDPAPLAVNAGKSFQGSIVLGMGFTFDDTDKDGVASSISLMHALIAKNPRNAERIFPYLGGEEISTSPIQKGHRFIINFADMSESQAREWPDLFRIVEERVKPQRLRDNREAYRRYWWQFAEKRLDLQQALAGKTRVVVVPRVGNAFAFAMVDARQVLNDKCIVFPHATFGILGLLQSRVHEIWTRFLSTTLKDDLQYTPSLCFETFPFPEKIETDSKLNLEAMGKEYYEFRASLMVKNNEGLTKTYNRFHDPSETAPDILKLRELHATMDRIVLNAYDWHDLKPTCEFLLDYEDDEEDDDGGQTRRRKKPWRYRWPDEFRDEVLARLLELNKQRAEIERVSGSAAEAAKKKSSKGTRKNGQRQNDQGRLPGM